MDAPLFKENTGFCLLCRNWKLLCRDSYQPGGKRAIPRSSYCIRCAQHIKEAAAFARSVAESGYDKSHYFDGHEERLAEHTRRIQHELGIIQDRERAERQAVKESLKREVGVS